MKFSTALLTTVFSVGTAFGVSSVANAKVEPIPAGIPIRFLTQEEMANIVDHKIEIRGFVQAAFDPIDPDSKFQSIPVFYRFIPKGAVLGSSARSEDAPTLVIVNGGPGQPSSGHLALDFDYSNPANNSGKANRLNGLNKYFNVVLVDQRGTAGYTIPLDMKVEKAKWNYSNVSRYFNSEVLAYDHSAVIQSLIKQNLIDPANYYLLGHSYGQKLTWSFMTLLSKNKISTKPTGIIVSAGALPTGRLADQWLSARQNQVDYNQRILQWSKDNGKPAYDRLVLDLREKISSIGGNPDSISFYYGMMLASAHNEQAIYEAMQTLYDNLSASAEPFKTYTEFVLKESDASNLLNHIMSIYELYGMYAKDLTVEAGDIAPWMIDPFKAFAIEETYSADTLYEANLYNPDTMDVNEARGFFARSDVNVVFHGSTLDIVSSDYDLRRKLLAELNVEPAKVLFSSHEGHRAFYTDFKPSFKALGLDLE